MFVRARRGALSKGRSPDLGERGAVRIATDLEVDGGVQVGGEDDTIETMRCALCALRARLDEALVRAGVVRVTLVANYERPRHGIAVFERTTVHLAFGDGRELAVGDGHSRDDAIAAALASIGVSL